MKKTTFLFLLLVVISTMLIAGCTTVQTLPAPATPAAPAVTAVPTYVQNQQGVAIIKTVTVTATPTVAVTANPSFEANITKTVVVKTDQAVSNVTNKTEQIVSNLVNKTEQKIANLTK
jgi:uncharacterized protein YceK